MENSGPGTGLYYFVDADLGKDSNFLTEIGASHIQLGNNKYVLDRDGWVKSLECYLKAVNIKIKKLGDGNKIKVKLTACQCQRKDLEVEVEKSPTPFDCFYDENKDLVSCSDCQAKTTIGGEFARVVVKNAKDSKSEVFSIVIYKDAKNEPQSSKTQLKFTGCRCKYRSKELGGEERVFEANLKGENYDPNKDLVACPQCQRQDKYNQFTKKDFAGNEVGNQGHTITLTIIYGVKSQPTTEKCADCQTEKKPDELLTIQDQSKEIKICQSCKTKRDSKDNGGKDNNQEQNEKKWGKDFGQLKPTQREGRIKTQNSWSQKKGISFVCLYCQKNFPMDKNIENYLEARQKAQNELNTHKNSCSLKNSEEAKTKLQKYWDEKKKAKDE